MPNEGKRSPEQLSEARQRGQQAANILSVAAPVLGERESQIMREMVGAFRAGKLDGTRAIAYAAALSEIYAFREEMEHRVRQGERAAFEVHLAAVPTPV